MDPNKYLNKTAPPEPQYSKEEYAAMKKAEREAVWAQVDTRMGEVLADAPALQEFLDFISQCRNSLPNQLLLSGQNADITDARTFQQWKDAGRHIRTGEGGYTAIIGQVYEANGRKAWQEKMPMTKEKFWQVIDNARAKAAVWEIDPLRESLYNQLLKLSPEELVGFDCAWQEYRRIAKTPQLIAAACIINGGTSDDRFDYFKNWLILQGQYAFRQALKDPDILAALKIPFDDTESEDCGYLTSLAFVGRALPAYFAQEGIAKELCRKYPALLQAPGALDAEIMRVLLYSNHEQEQAFDRYLLGLEVQHYIDISGLESYDKFYQEHISGRWEWDFLRETILEEEPRAERKLLKSRSEILIRFIGRYEKAMLLT